MKDYKQFARAAKSLPLDSREQIIAEVLRLPGFKEEPLEDCPYIDPDEWCASHELPRSKDKLGRNRLFIIVRLREPGLHEVCLTQDLSFHKSDAIYAIEEEFGVDARRGRSDRAVWQLPDRLIDISLGIICVRPLKALEHTPWESQPD